MQVLLTEMGISPAPYLGCETPHSLGRTLPHQPHFSLQTMRAGYILFQKYQIHQIQEEKGMKIVSIAVSRKKGTRKTPVEEAFVSRDHGLEGDAHAGKWHRQVSFLASESIEKAREKGLDVTFGDFAENIATTGIDWKKLPVGSRIRLGNQVLVEITQIGKECHNKCAIYYKAGDCIMPREGVFGRVLEEGTIRCGDPIKIMS